MRHAVIIFGLLISLGVQAQQTVLPTENSGDYPGAILISDSLITCLKTPVGFGKTQEIKSSKQSIYLFEKEHNTIWYKIKISETCLMSLDIIPESINDDYDFVIWKLDTLSSKFNPQLATPVRSNIARNEKSIKSKTGLGNGNTPTHVGQGVNSSYSKALDVKKGEVYILAVDNRYDKGSGHKIIFHYSGCITAIQAKKKYYLNLNLINKETNREQIANISILKYRKGEKYDTIFNSAVSSREVEVDSGSSYQIIIKQTGFFKIKDEQKIFGREQIQNLTYLLQSIEVGKKILVENIYFNGGTDVILSKSYKSLKQLAEVLKENPTVKIEIQGHVNQPYNAPKDMSEEGLLDLSVRRAKAVYMYLLKRGIDESRLSFKGFGNNQMLFPYAKNEVEQEQNRRVEILILEI